MSNLIERFLANAKPSMARRGSLVFALDATASREKTWDAAVALQARMFQEVTTVGTLSMQLVYYRGVRGMGGECKASRWVEDPMSLAKTMSEIKCVGGNTQIQQVLEHVARESSQRKINAVVFVGDMCEEGRDVLVGGINRLAALNIPVFMFQEGQDRVAQVLFEEIARTTRGAYRQINQGSLSELAELLKLVSVFAVGGVGALEDQNSPNARHLLGQIKR